MKRLIPFALMLCLAMTACDSGKTSGPNNNEDDDQDSDNKEHVVVPVDYTLGRAMNKRLGKGINLGNAWDGNSYWSCGTLAQGDTTYYQVNGVTYPVYLSGTDAQYFNNLPMVRYNYGENCDDLLDGAWSNPIKDEYFRLLKDAGFNSVRIPVRWQHNSDPVTHKVNPARLAGVKEDVQLAIDAGLAVVVSFHWYYEMSFFATNAAKFPELYKAEKEHFAAIWSEVATAFKDFPDTMLVWDLLNEPTMTQASKLNEVMKAGYEAIRAADPNKTIMFESYQAGRFKALRYLELPEDGNIIFSGHYYEPFEYSHQGHSSMYSCKGDAAYGSTAFDDFQDYVFMAMDLYPDINGKPLPMNMGEFGISGGPGGPCERKGQPGPSNAKRALWAQKAIENAEAYGISWHYWGFVGVGGFEAYDKTNNAWYEGFPDAFGL